MSFFTTLNSVLKHLVQEARREKDDDGGGAFKQVHFHLVQKNAKNWVFLIQHDYQFVQHVPEYRGEDEQIRDYIIMQQQQQQQQQQENNGHIWVFVAALGHVNSKFIQDLQDVVLGKLRVLYFDLCGWKWSMTTAAGTTTTATNEKSGGEAPLPERDPTDQDASTLVERRSLVHQGFSKLILSNVKIEATEDTFAMFGTCPKHKNGSEWSGRVMFLHNKLPLNSASGSQIFTETLLKNIGENCRFQIGNALWMQKAGFGQFSIQLPTANAMTTSPIMVTIVISIADVTFTKQQLDAICQCFVGTVEYLMDHAPPHALRKRKLVTEDAAGHQDADYFILNLSGSIAGMITRSRNTTFQNQVLDTMNIADFSRQGVTKKTADWIRTQLNM